MKFRGHETFHIRKGWLYKGIKNVINDPSVFVSKQENPMDILGIGSNMVKSLRYWLQAANLTIEPSYGKRDQQLTDIGKIIYDNDPYFEEIGSLWLVHYAIASNEALATSWYIFFNEFDVFEFDEEDFFKRVKQYVTMIDVNKLPAERVISDDYKCIITTYYSRTHADDKKINPEDNTYCPLTELKLINYVTTEDGMKIYRKNTPEVNTIPELIATAILLNAVGKSKEVKISFIQNGKNNLGKILNLDTMSLLNLLYKIEALGYIRVVRTAGLDIVNIITDMTPLDCVKKYYSELNEI